MNKLAIPTTITDMIATREQALSLLSHSMRLKEKAQGMLNELGSTVYPAHLDGRSSLEEKVKDIDRRLWRLSFDKAGFYSVMDNQAVAEFERDLERNTPAFTLDNIRATIVTFAAQQDEIFCRGIVNVFRQLSKSHRTNTKEAFKIGRKVIKGYMFENFMGLQLRYSAVTTLNDIDRVFKILDNKPHNPRELEININTAVKEGKPYEDDYYIVKGFLNGNMHMTFKRDDLLEKVNDMIAEYYAENSLASRAA